jgi:hypothetical protein
MIDLMTDHLDLSSDGTRPARVWIPDPDEHPTISVPDASAIAGVAKRTGYAAAKRGEWPVHRVGRSVRVRTRQFLALYGPETDL